LRNGTGVFGKVAARSTELSPQSSKLGFQLQPHRAHQGERIASCHGAQLDAVVEADLAAFEEVFKVEQGGLVAIAGVIVGLGLAYAGSRLIASLLYGISARDPAVFAATTVLLLTVALLACWLPARRGARLSPLEALRAE
jgi:hypothetical protein